MAIERVKTYFRQYGMEEKIRELDMSSATVELAAAALSCEPARIAKTLSFMVDGHALLVVAAGDVKIDNHKYKGQFGVKAKMLSPEEAESLVGHAVGGVCPFALFLVSCPLLYFILFLSYVQRLRLSYSSAPSISARNPCDLSAFSVFGNSSTTCW